MKLIKTADDTETFLNEEVGESYHSQTGAVEEAFKKYAVPCKIKELAKGKIKILDICSGILYNSAAAIDTALEENPDCEIEVTALEFDPEIVEKIQVIDPPFRCYGLIKKISRHNCVVEEGKVRIKLVLGDARETVKELPDDHFDAVFMDPFSPKTAPEMWKVSFFKEIYRVIKENRIMATYTCARMARDNMKEAEFSYDNGPIVGRRGPGTVAWKEEFFKV